MGALRVILLLALFALLAAAAPARADPVAQWRAYVDEASMRFDVPAEWIERVIRAESGGRTTLGGRPIRSPAGAMGLMQLMPRTWADMRARLRLGRNPDQPRDNILAGTFYLRLMHDRFGYPGLFAAYNAGPARYAAVLGGKSRLPAETRASMAATARSGVPLHHIARQAPLPARRLEPEPRAAEAGIFFIRRDAAAKDFPPPVREHET